MAYTPPPPPDPRFGSFPPPPPQPAPRFEVLPPSPGTLPQQRPVSGKKKGGLVGILAALGVLMAKFAPITLVFFKMGFSMLLSVGGYAILFGWKFAAGFVLLIFLHEMGHFVAATFYRVPVSAPMFIPFMGAYVTLKNRPMNPWTNAVISYAGPFAGACGGWACLYAALAFEAPWMMAVASYTLFLNAFNLLPIPGLDGSYLWIAFSRNRTPTMRVWQRAAVAFLLAGLLAGLGYGYWESSGFLRYLRTH